MTSRIPLQQRKWFYPDARWMGFLHLPLLLLSAYALILPRIQARKAG